MGRLLAWFGGAAVAAALVGCSGPVVPDRGEGTASSGLEDGTALSESEVASLLQQAGFPSNVIGKMVCTAKYESSFNPSATNNNNNGSTDYGLFQINSVHLGSTPGCPSSANALFDPLTNAQCAYGVYELQGVNAWVAYRSHKSECDGYQVDDVGAAAAPTAPGGNAGSYGVGPTGSPQAGNDPYGDPYATGANPYGQGPDDGNYGGGYAGGPSYGGSPNGGSSNGGYSNGGYSNTPNGGGANGGYGTDGMSDFAGAEGDEDCDPYTGEGCGGSGGDVIIWYF